ncbi:LLM class flavin-dependent oxidoreductase [Gordonia desulfuricans]|uniref:LLM class flavin-dependent oxidoreductase n=1 Tax=Gordonia desulfuricans TaxID=89051 RepID=A0A7K3LJ21_9ACTN|nr:LLM class flavin-dependent oxidoreductase [Gordonia desulfuricans]NDK88173.1 LLM class flavin-dependent oxidoreductase [Gordonia desulfuricans]
MAKTSVGVFIATSTPPEDIGSKAALAEELGFGEVWTAEDYFQYGGFTAAAAALAATTDVRVGLGIVASVARHPAVTAMETATLARCHPGRFIAGIGHGVPFWTGQMGLTPKSPLTALRECVTAVRALLSGETVTSEGRQFTFDNVALAHPPTIVPEIVTGVLGPKSLALSGEIADGTVMSVLAGATYLEAVVADISRGMTVSGRTEHSLPTFALFSIDEDEDAARQRVRGPLAGYLAAVGPHNPLSAAYGYNETLAELITLAPDEFAAALPEEWIDTLTVAGNPASVGRRIEELRAAGATSVVLSPVDPATAAAELRLFADTTLREIPE